MLVINKPVQKEIEEMVRKDCEYMLTDPIEIKIIIEKYSKVLEDIGIYQK